MRRRRRRDANLYQSDLRSDLGQPEQQPIAVVVTATTRQTWPSCLRPRRLRPRPLTAPLHAPDLNLLDVRVGRH